MFRFALHILIVLILTLLTQIGGVAYLIALAASRAWGIRRFLAKLAIFLLFYAGASFAAGLAAAPPATTTISISRSSSPAR
ncbi:hypothetical protein RLEG12_22690 [Rhizobium leguminosarum bv. trifolii CB782]|nr:hypothetical protein RLEG12_22690 [Rhizobium leguminosarum bv. trifolii CB782]